MCIPAKTSRTVTFFGGGPITFNIHWPPGPVNTKPYCQLLPLCPKPYLAIYNGIIQKYATRYRCGFSYFNNIALLATQIWELFLPLLTYPSAITRMPANYMFAPITN